MASFNSTIITEKGHALMSKIVAGTASPNFTKISVSDYQYPVGTDFEALTAMTSVKQTTLVSSVSKVNDAAVKVSGVLSNAALNTGYYLRAIGLYAMDPNEGEILYSITSAIQPDWIPPNNGISASSVMIDLITVVSNASNVSLEVDPNAVATIEQLEAIPQKSFYADIEAYYGNTKLIDDFQDESLWNAGSTGVPSIDASNVKIGKKSLKVTSNGNASGVATTRNDISKDVSKLINGESITDADYLIAVMYIEDIYAIDASLADAINIKLSSDTPFANTNMLQFRGSITDLNLVTGWNFVKFKISDGIPYGEFDLSNLQSMELLWRGEMDGAASTDKFVSWQLIQFVKKDPSADYPNPFQKHGIREFDIELGEWFVGLEFGSIVWKLLYSPSTVYKMITGQISYKNFVAVGRIFGTSNQYKGYLYWGVTSSKYIRVWNNSSTLRLIINEGSGEVEYLLNLSVTTSDVLDFELSKNSGAITLIAYKNNDRTKPYILRASSAILANEEGYLGLGGFATPNMNYYSKISITELQHSYHADVAEIAKCLTEQPMVRISSDVSQSIPNATVTALVFNTIEKDNRQHFDLDDPGKLKIKETGVYSISANVAFDSNVTAYRNVYIRKNGLAINYACLNTVNGAATVINISAIVHCKMGDIIECTVLQASGGALNVSAAPAGTNLSIAKIG